MDEVWARLAFDPSEISSLTAERVIAVVHTSGLAKGSGIEIDQELTHLWTVRDGKAIRLETYSTRREALEAAGLSE
jgi:ketosteroid isomerase-like protein